jgi:hypothetical protein
MYGQRTAPTKGPYQIASLQRKLDFDALNLDMEKWYKIVTMILNALSSISNQYTKTWKWIMSIIIFHRTHRHHYTSVAENESEGKSMT